MNLSFTNATLRSADDLLADLKACRQLRHISDDEKEIVVRNAFREACTPIPKPPIKHPDPNNLCSNCENPRSKFTGSSSGLCRECYHLLAVQNRKTLWVSDCFEVALRDHGYACDTCDEITQIPPDRLELAANRILENMDGRVRTILCKKCSQIFLGFCTREFGRDGHLVDGKDLDKIMLAWIAQNVRRVAMKVAREQP